MSGVLCLVLLLTCTDCFSGFCRGAFLANIVNPLVQVVESFLSVKHKPLYEIAVFTEVHRSRFVVPLIFSSW
jgi:sorbitol-specific phosphotransferase system component IIC